ncbi:MAG: hypothetical protein KG075_16295 [Alphaproteobacteria bacterium]|nr:hypothetical protein [Alphaproteobacteria bacterium]
MSQEFLVEQVESYQKTIGRKRRSIWRFVRVQFGQILGVYIAIAAGLFTIGFLVLATPGLTQSAMEGGYLLYLRHAPLSAVRYFSNDAADWLADIRLRDCALEYEARVRIEHHLFGKTSTLLYPEYMRCIEATRRTDI